MKHLVRKSDLILIGAILLAALVFLLLRSGFRKDGGAAVIYVDGVKTAVYPLDTDAEIRLENEYGYNILVIKDGTASVSAADCPDLICAKTHSVRYSGESITCLPHRTVIRIEGAGGKEVDLGI